MSRQMKRMGAKIRMGISRLVLLLEMWLIITIGQLFAPFRVPWATHLLNTVPRFIPPKIQDQLAWSIRRAVTAYPALRKTLETGTVLILYYSMTGNTEKVARAIARGMRHAGLHPTIKKVATAMKEDYYAYDLVCFGTPVYHALPPPPVMKLIRSNFSRYRQPPSNVRLPARRIPGKYALIFVTYSGPHVGIHEALPTGKYLVQEFEHLGFEVKAEWYIISEFHGWVKGSTQGRLGDIRGRPNAGDLKRIEEKTISLVMSIFPTKTKASHTSETDVASSKDEGGEFRGG